MCVLVLDQSRSTDSRHDAALARVGVCSRPFSFGRKLRIYGSLSPRLIQA